MSGVQRACSVKRVSFMEGYSEKHRQSTAGADGVAQFGRRSERSDTLSNLEAWLMQ